MDAWVYVAIGIGAYLWGSLSPALIISDRIGKKDVRKYGSGNAGTTNMMRTFGWKFGLMTFVLDVIKGVAAALIGRWVGGQIGMSVAAVLVIVGHNWPVYYGFKGGKGIASTLGVMFVLMPMQTAILLPVVILIMALTRYVSVGSMLGVILESICVFIFYPGETLLQVTVVVLTVLALFGHRENIKRLCNGTENKLSFHK
ncbi:MAG: glycerol-3-phosphate 1-O-acyltransferase PlsY [Clostridiales bacterium]|nr:glycerol-3-phosphate 1-O-acyltransferase PlsY [Clostridiales bacterium]